MARAPSVTHLFPSNENNKKAPVALNRRLCNPNLDKEGFGELLKLSKIYYNKLHIKTREKACLVCFLISFKFGFNK